MCFNVVKTQNLSNGDIQVVHYENTCNADANEGGIDAYLKTVIFNQRVDEDGLSSVLKTNQMDTELYAEVDDKEIKLIKDMLNLSLYPSETRKAIIVYGVKIKHFECSNGFAIDDFLTKYLDKGYTIFIPFIYQTKKLLEYVIKNFSKRHDMYISYRTQEDNDFASYAIAPVRFI